MSLLAKLTQFPQAEALSKKNPFFSLDQDLLNSYLQEGPPPWMQAQIEAELSPFSSLTSLKLMQAEETFKTQGIDVYRFEIRQRKLIWPQKKDVFQIPRVLKMVVFLQLLLKAVDLPDLQFLYSPGDYLFTSVEGKVPLFLISKTAKQTGLCLFPHVEWMNFWELTRKQLKKQNALLPWTERKEQIFWRGATSGLGYHDGMNPRWQVVQLSQQYPEEIEAHFSQLVQCQNLAPMSTLQIRPLLSPWHQAKYKYLLALDGNCFPGSFQWQLGSGSVVIKQESPYLEWYYGGLMPHVHYLPTRADAQDVLAVKQKIGPVEALKIVERSQHVSDRLLSAEGIGSYVVFLLRAYSSLWKEEKGWS